MKTALVNEKAKKNQPTEKKSGNDDFPQECEEQRNEDLRMNPQPLKPEKSKTK